MLNLENDIIELLIVTYRLEDWLLESGNKVGIALFETSKFRWHAQYEQQRSFSICYPSPVFGFKFYCFTNSTPYLLRVKFLTFLRGLPHLVLLGVRLTVLGQNLGKYESSEKLSGGPPTARIIAHLIAYRQLRPKNSKTLKTSFHLLKHWKLSILTYSQTFALSNFVTFISWERANYSKNFEFSNLWERVSPLPKTNQL